MIWCKKKKKTENGHKGSFCYCTKVYILNWQEKKS
jgi:hypothetical protein